MSGNGPVGGGNMWGNTPMGFNNPPGGSSPVGSGMPSWLGSGGGGQSPVSLPGLSNYLQQLSSGGNPSPNWSNPGASNMLGGASTNTPGGTMMHSNLALPTNAGRLPMQGPLNGGANPLQSGAMMLPRFPAGGQRMAPGPAQMAPMPPMQPTPQTPMQPRPTAPQVTFNPGATQGAPLGPVFRSR